MKSFREDRHRILRALFVLKHQYGEDGCSMTKVATITNVSIRKLRFLLQPMNPLVSMFTKDKNDPDTNDPEIQLTIIGLRAATKLYKGTSMALLLNFFEVLFSSDDTARFHAWVKDQRIRDPSLWKLDVLEEHHQAPASSFDILLPMYEAFPQLCNNVDPNTRLYALHKASKLGLSWELGVKHVYEASRDVGGYPDPETGLFPFQLAQQKKKGQSKKRGKADSTTELDLAYNLLRSCPSLIGQKLFDPNSMPMLNPVGHMLGPCAGTLTLVAAKTIREGTKDDPIIVPVVFSSSSNDSDSEEYEYSDNSDNGDDDEEEEEEEEL